jgi:hypothetical protein
VDKRKNNGGTKGNKGGRPPKVEEQKLIERLTPLAENAYKALDNALKDEQGWAVKLFMEYMYGKAKQQIDQTTTLKVNEFDISKLYDKKT